MQTITPEHMLHQSICIFMESDEVLYLLRLSDDETPLTIQKSNNNYPSSTTKLDSSSSAPVVVVVPSAASPVEQEVMEKKEEQEEDDLIVEECDVPPVKKTKSKQRVIFSSIHKSFPLFDITFSQIGSCCRRFFAN